MTARQDLISAALFKEVPGGFVYRKPKFLPPAEFYLVDRAQRDAIADCTFTQNPLRLIIVISVVVLALIGALAGLVLRWPVLMTGGYFILLLGCAVAAMLAASCLNVRRVRHLVEPILAKAKRTDQTFTRRDVRAALAKVGTFRQSWLTAVAFGLLSLFLLAIFVWDHDAVRATPATYLPLLQVVVFAIGAALVMRAALDKIGLARAPQVGDASLFTTRPRALAVGAVAVWGIVFVALAVIGFRHEYSDMTTGLRLQAAGDHRGAIAHFSLAQAANPTDARVYRARAAAYKAAGNQAGALEDLNKAIALEPNRAISYRERGIILSSQGKPVQAIADYDTAINLGAKDNLSYFLRGAAYSLNKSPDAAIADFSKALALSPNDQHSYLHRGWAHQAKGDHDSAIADFNRASAIQPKYIWPVVARGMSYKSKKDFAAAIASFSDAIALDATLIQAYYQRAETYSATKAMEQAVQDYRMLLTLPAATDADRTYQSMAQRQLTSLTSAGAPEGQRK